MRPTAAMLMQHPFFLKHAAVILRSSAMIHSRTTSRASNTGGIGTIPNNHQALPDETILNLLSVEDEYMDSKNSHDTIVFSSDDQGTNNANHNNNNNNNNNNNGGNSSSQSALSRLTEKRLSRAGSKITQTPPSMKSNSASSSMSNVNNASLNNFATTPTSTTDKNDSILENEEDEMITAIRLEHLERIVEKIETRYNQYVLMRKRDKENLRQQQQQNSNNSGYIQQHSSFRSMMSSRSFFKSSKVDLIAS